jgi:hypothetical protein
MKRGPIMRAALSLLALVVFAVPLPAQERLDEDVFWRIRQEVARRSQILPTVQALTDQFAPRLTGSPNLKAAGEWAVGRMESWGLVNGRLEPFDFGRPGWMNERLAAHIVSPLKDALVVEALGWTPGTDGVVRAEAMRLPPPPNAPTQAELDAFFDTLRTAVRGKVVLAGPPATVPVNFSLPEMRLDDTDLLRRLNAPPAQAGRGGGGRGGAAGQQGPRRLTAREVGLRFNEFLLAAGVAVRINDAALALGQIRAFNTASYDPTKAPPAVMMRNEDYGRIWRLLERGPVELEFEIVNRLYPEGRTSHNAVAEIPGTDKADEVVMLGAHLDAWHAGTGATDNAAGVAVVMEAVRVLNALGLRPRRTIRVALWGGEEQGLLGSQAYVRDHLGTFEAPKPAFESFAGYLNVDSGTGRVRSMNVFGPVEAGTVLRQILAGFIDLGVVGVNTTRTRGGGGSDHASFNQAGLPGMNVQQDPIQYDSFTWHSNLDTYERIVEGDLKQATTVVAAVVYHLATREQRLPRFPANEMPPAPGGRGGTQ